MIGCALAKKSVIKSLLMNKRIELGASKLKVNQRKHAAIEAFPCG